MSKQKTEQELAAEKKAAEEKAAAEKKAAEKEAAEKEAAEKDAAEKKAAEKEAAEKKAAEDMAAADKKAAADDSGKTVTVSVARLQSLHDAVKVKCEADKKFRGAQQPGKVDRGLASVRAELDSIIKNAK